MTPASWNLSQSEAWQGVERLFELNDGFAFVVLLVPSEEGSAICHEALRRHLQTENRTLLDLSPADDTGLAEIRGKLVDIQPSPEVGAVWVSRAISEDNPACRTCADAWFEAADKLRSQPGKELALARFLYRAGLGFAARYQWQDAVRVFTESLDLSLTFGSTQTDLADYRFQVARTLTRINRYEEAAALLEMATAGYAEAGNRLGQANCISGLGDIHLRRSDHDSARAAFQKALAMYRSISDPYSSGRALYSLARLETTPKDPTPTRRRSHRRLDLHQSPRPHRHPPNRIPQ